MYSRDAHVYIRLFYKAKNNCHRQTCMMKRQLVSASETGVLVGTSTLCSLARVKNSSLCARHGQATAAVLRQRVRLLGYRKWYCLKKKALVGVIVVDESVRIIVRVFRSMLQHKRRQLIALRVAAGSQSTCPICMTPLQELREDELFAHDGFVFCKEDIVSFISSGYNFSNPITRRHIDMHDVRTLGSDDLCDAYGKRETLRKGVVDSYSHFFFMENDVPVTYRQLLSVVEFSGTSMFHEQLFKELFANFDRQVHQMSQNDAKRTVCVLNSLRAESTDMLDVTHRWSCDVIDRYITNVTR